MRVSRFALPDDANCPTEALQCSFGFNVPLGVSLKLCPPEISVTRGDAAFLAMGMLMPKAAMHLDRHAMNGQNNVRFARQVVPMDAKSVSQAVEVPSHQELG
jgi:hypothetical protein